MPELYIIAGPNGAGKTTASFTLLPQIFNVKEFVNADEIARGLSPFNPESVAFEAGRIMLQRLEQLIGAKKTFAFETTLTTKSYVHLIERSRRENFKVTLLFLYLPFPELAIERVRTRVLKGGHNIPEDVIRRRYQKGLKNFVDLFMSLSDQWIIADNSSTMPAVIAKGYFDKVEFILQPDIWNNILVYGKKGK